LTEGRRLRRVLTMRLGICRSFRWFWSVLSPWKHRPV
jgi:hypothetical protein